MTEYGETVGSKCSEDIIKFTLKDEKWLSAVDNQYVTHRFYSMITAEIIEG